MGTSSEDNAEHRVRVKVFVDFWNFQLAVNNAAPQFPIDWMQLGTVLAKESLAVIDPTARVDYQGMNVYGSYNPTSDSDRSLIRWATNTLDRFAGVQVTMLPRQRKHSPPSCPTCHIGVSICPSCGADMRGTEEKGVDTRIATDMVSLAWVDNYEVATLVSADRDFIPVVEFLNTRGIKVIHGSFPHSGAQLTATCWGSIDIPSLMTQFRRH